MLSVESSDLNVASKAHGEYSRGCGSTPHASIVQKISISKVSIRVPRALEWIASKV